MNDPFAERAAITVSGLLQSNIASLETRAPHIIAKSGKDPEVLLEITKRAVASLKTLQEFVEKEVTSGSGKFELMMAKALIGGMTSAHYEEKNSKDDDES